MIFPTAVRELAEKWLRAKSPQEAGGIFLGNSDRLSFFLPLPNVQSTSRQSYNYAPEAFVVARALATLAGSEVMGHLHSHPDGTVPSEADLRFLQSAGFPIMLIAGLHADRIDWWAIDKSGKPIPLLESDEKAELVSLLLAGRLGLADLGRVMRTPKGELLTETEAGRFLRFDEEACRVWEVWRSKDHVIASICRKTGISAPKVKKIIQQLGGLA